MSQRTRMDAAPGSSSVAGPLRHFLELRDFDAVTLREMLDVATALKASRFAPSHALRGRAVALVFGKPSTRTRVSFEIGVRQLGGEAIVLSSQEMQLGRGETIADTARVLSRYVQAIVLRTDSPAKLDEMMRHASVPVINGLTAASHPCQVMADVLTFEEHRGPIAGNIVAWCGDANNVARSWIEAAVVLGFTLRLATPIEMQPLEETLAWAAARGGSIESTRSPHEAVAGARCVVTDAWVSMADDPALNRAALLAPYQVNADLMRHAAADALFMHCLPAHRGEEVTEEVIDGPQSVVFDEAENRLHVQKSILLWALGVPPAGR